ARPGAREQRVSVGCRSLIHWLSPPRIFQKQPSRINANKFFPQRASSFLSSARNANQVSARFMPRSIRSRKNVFAIADSKSAKLFSTKSRQRQNPALIFGAIITLLLPSQLPPARAV